MLRERIRTGVRMRVPFKMKQERGYPQDKLLGWPFFWLLFFGHAKKSDSSADETWSKKEFRKLKITY